MLQLKAVKSLQLLASTESPNFTSFSYASAIKLGRTLICCGLIPASNEAPCNSSFTPPLFQWDGEENRKKINSLLTKIKSNDNNKIYYYNNKCNEEY